MVFPAVALAGEFSNIIELGAGVCTDNENGREHALSIKLPKAKSMSAQRTLTSTPSRYLPDTDSYIINVIFQRPGRLNFAATLSPLDKIRSEDQAGTLSRSG